MKKKNRKQNQQGRTVNKIERKKKQEIKKKNNNENRTQKNNDDAHAKKRTKARENKTTRKNSTVVQQQQYSKLRWVYRTKKALSHSGFSLVKALLHFLLHIHTNPSLLARLHNNNYMVGKHPHESASPNTLSGSGSRTSKTNNRPSTGGIGGGGGGGGRQCHSPVKVTICATATYIPVRAMRLPEVPG